MPSYCFRKIADFFDQPCLLLDRDRNILEANIAARRLLSLPAPPVYGSLYRLSATPVQEIDRYLRLCSTGTIPKPGQLDVALRDGGIHPFYCFGARYVIDGVEQHPFLFLRLSRKWGTLTKLTQLRRQISEQHRALRAEREQRQEVSSELASALLNSRVDRLTGLLNRNALIEDCESLGRDWSSLTSRFLAYVLIDLDGMKSVNDRFGHEVGDRVLGRFGRALRRHFRDEDRIYRAGGDEFVCLIENESAVLSLGDRLAEVVGEIREEHPDLDCSLGLALASEVTGLDDLYVLADRRMYEEKRRHKGRRGE